MTASDLVLVSYDQTNTQGVADSVVKYLRRDHEYDVVVVGPGHGRELVELPPTELARARFFLELDSVSGNLFHTEGLDRLRCPKLAWFVDSHKKPHFHQRIAPDFDLVFFTMAAWAGLFGERGRWLPVHYDEEWIGPRPRVTPRFDVGFVGSQPRERTVALQEIAGRHGLSLLLETTTGPHEKERTADLYAQCRIVFNRHVANDLNFRMVEAPACRRLLVTDAQRNGQYELFQDRVHVAYYKDDQDLEEVLLHYVRDEEERERVAAAGHALVSRLHTTRARVRELVAAGEGLATARGRAARAAVRSGSSSAVQAAMAGGDVPGTRPRVLLLAGEIEAADRGGGAMAWAKGLAAADAEIVVLALSAPADPDHGVRWEVVAGPPLPPLAVSARTRRYFEATFLLDAALDLVAAEPGFALVVTLCPEHAVAARELGGPYVMHLSAVPTEADRLELAEASLVLATTAATRELAMRLAPGLAGRVIIDEGTLASCQAAMAVAKARDASSSGAARLDAEVAAEPVARSSAGRSDTPARPDVTIAIVCCDRPDVLEATLATTRTSLVASELAVEWIAFDNGSTSPVGQVLADAGMDLVLRSGTNRGLAPALDALYREARGRYVLVLEDDWACLHPSHAWLDLAVEILDTQPDVGVVRLRKLNDDQCGHFDRHHPEVALRHHPWTVRPFPHHIVETRELDGQRYYVAAAPWANWTHNPTLVRREVRDWIGPVSEYLPDPRDHRPNEKHPGLEGAIDARWRPGPWKVAKLIDGPFTHIGDQPARVEAS